MNAPTTRAGFVAIVGAPNAGKSTLVNALVGSKVSIVSPKVQTTRMRVIGIAYDRSAGWWPRAGRAGRHARHLPRRQAAAGTRDGRCRWQGAEDADVVGLMSTPSAAIGQETRAIIERLKESKAPRYLILTRSTWCRARRCCR
jgi:GTP-binding protein Era